MNDEYKIKYVKKSIPNHVEKNTVLNILTNDVTSFTHGFHKYPAKFIPQVPQWAISKCLNISQRKLILDPFCGSGTTLVESMLARHNTIGIDIDPLSSLISKVKTTPLNIKELLKISNWLIESIKKKKKGYFKPDCKTIEHWFTKDSINKLSIIRTLINQITERFGNKKLVIDIQEFLLICFSSIIRRVSNTDNESQKTYVSHTKLKKPEEVYTLFFSQLDYFIKRISVFSEAVNSKVNAQVICADSSQLLYQRLKEKKIDLAITSPPYIKAVDYIYNQMAELFWIGDIFDMQTQFLQNNKKKTYIGTKHIHKVEFKDFTPYNTTFGINKLDNKLKKVYETDNKYGHKHSYITYKYFTDMEKHFIEMAKCLNSGTPYIMVVGDSTVSNVYFETSDFLIDIAKRNGFKIKYKWGYKIKNRYMRFDRKGRGGIIKIDWVLNFIRK